jgi:predicted outer membrane protein
LAITNFVRCIDSRPIACQVVPAQVGARSYSVGRGGPTGRDAPHRTAADPARPGGADAPAQTSNAWLSFSLPTGRLKPATRRRISGGWMTVDHPAVPMVRSRLGAGHSARPETRPRWRRPLTVALVGVLAVLGVGWLSVAGAVAEPATDSARAGRPRGHGGDVRAADGSTVLASAGETVETSWGPLTPADRDFLVRVRLAGLWEMPAGDIAQTYSADQRVREVGRTLHADHLRLDAQVRQLSRRLQVVLPDQPNADQRAWLSEMRGLRGVDFDASFANRLRVAHGRVFTVVAEVRAGTRNSAVRAFAQVAVDVVMKHMTLLESTGMVAPAEATTLAPPAPRGPITTPLILTVVVLTAAANIAVAARRSSS